MKGKKALHGFHWDALWISLVASFLIFLVYSPSYASIPNVGERSIAISNSLEDQSEKILVRGMADELISRSLSELGSREIDGLTGCGSIHGYPLFKLETIDECINDGFRQEDNFKNIFNEKFDSVRSKTFPGLDISDVDYELSVEAVEGVSTLFATTDSKIESPITLPSSGEKIGTKLSNPSFSKNIDYDFTEIGSLKDTLRNVAENCGNPLKSRDCMEENLDNEKFALSDSCIAGQEQDFYNLVEYFELCSGSQDKSCICTQNNPSLEGTFEINQAGSNAEIISKSKPELKATVRDADLVDNYLYIGDASYLHRDHEGKIIVQGYFGADQCRPKPKTVYRFCVESKNNDYLDYEEGVEKPMRYKFALDFGPQEPYDAPEVGISEGIKNLFEEKNVIVAAECLDEQEKVFELSRELGDKLAEASAQVIVPVGENRCNEINNLDKYKSQTKENMLIVIGAFESDESTVEYNPDSEESEKLSQKILDEIYNLNGFSDEISPSPQNFLSSAEISAEILFTSEKISEDKNFVNAILSGIINYLTKIEFEYSEVPRPIEKKGTVELEWVWEAAKAENVNYKLLYSIINTESSFENINEKDDGKAHGLGQQFEPAIRDIHDDLVIRHPELGDMGADEIYENVLTSKDEQSLKAQITATALYLKWTRNALASSGKPTDTQTVIQAYHDGVGNINEDGTSKLIESGDEEASNYYTKVASGYNSFTTA